MATNHPLVGARGLRLADCLRHSFILPDRSIGIRKFIETALDGASVDIVAPITTNSITLIKSMLAYDQSLTILSIFDVYAEVMRGDLAFVSIEDSSLSEETLVIAVPSNRRVSPPAQEMMDILKSKVIAIDRMRMRNTA
jgi:DNA-binding transcriptional LysR family regulator